METEIDEEIIKVETEERPSFRIDSPTSIKTENVTSDLEETYSTTDIHYDIDIKLENDTDYQSQNDALDNECRQFIDCEALTSYNTVQQSAELEKPTSNQNEENLLSTTNPGNKIENNLRNNTNGLFQCKYCSYSTPFLCTLNKHIHRWHESNKISFPFYKCKRCEYKTLYLNHLQDHLKIVHPQKPLKVLRCKECDFESSKVTTMKWHCYVKHVKQSAGSLLLKCEHCKFTSKDLGSMKCHLKFCQNKR